ncbi:hypothetical protein Tco_0228736 [Tanacetum coccineum]
MNLTLKGDAIPPNCDDIDMSCITLPILRSVSSSKVVEIWLSSRNYEAFYLEDDHVEEKSSGSTTTHADFSQYDSLIFDLLINPFPPADRSDVYNEEFAGELAHIISPPE